MAAEITFGNFQTAIEVACGSACGSVKFTAFAHLRLPSTVNPTVDAPACIDHGEKDVQVENPTRVLQVKWIRPEPGWIKLNCDGAVSKGLAGCGYVLRDDAGLILGAGCCPTPELRVIDAELRGMWEGLKTAVMVTEPGQKIWIEGDSMNLIAALKRKFESYLFDRPVAMDVLRLLSHFSEFRASHIYREGNQPADWLAGKGKFSPQPFHLTSDFPRELVMLAQRDLSRRYPRVMKK